MKAFAVCNTKGGTGKTLVALNIAHELSKKYKVGLIDADFDSANFAQFANVNDCIDINTDNRFDLVDWQGIKVFSMSLLVDKWRAVSMTADRYVQMLDDVMQYGNWGDLDYMVIDLPAGSSDVFRGVLTIFADCLIGNVIVLHPSAKDDTQRVIRLHQHYEIPVLGVIENMSYFEDADGRKYYVFGHGNIDEVCEKYGLHKLGVIPLTEAISVGMMTGEPFLPDSLSEPIRNAVHAIETARVAETSIIDKIKTVITDAVVTEVQRVLATFINEANRVFNIRELQRQHGFTEKAPFDLIIPDPSRRKVIARVHLKVDNYIKVLTHAKPKFEVVVDIKTLARVILGKRRTSKGKIVPYDYWDAWLNGDIQIYGIGHLPRASRAFKELFTNEAVITPIRQRWGAFLERFI